MIAPASDDVAMVSAADDVMTLSDTDTDDSDRARFLSRFDDFLRDDFLLGDNVSGSFAAAVMPAFDDDADVSLAETSLANCSKLEFRESVVKGNAVVLPSLARGDLLESRLAEDDVTNDLPLLLWPLAPSVECRGDKPEPNGLNGSSPNDVDGNSGLWWANSGEM